MPDNFLVTVTLHNNTKTTLTLNPFKNSTYQKIDSTQMPQPSSSWHGYPAVEIKPGELGQFGQTSEEIHPGMEFKYWDMQAKVTYNLSDSSTPLVFTWDYHSPNGDENPLSITAPAGFTVNPSVICGNYHCTALLSLSTT